MEVLKGITVRRLWGGELNIYSDGFAGAKPIKKVN
jgi:hypothetical protein